MNFPFTRTIKVDATNPTSAGVTIQSATDVDTVTAVSGNNTNHVGQTFNRTLNSINPLSVEAGAQTTVSFSFTGHCSNSFLPGQTGTGATTDERGHLTINTSAGQFVLDTSNVFHLEAEGVEEFDP